MHSEPHTLQQQAEERADALLDFYQHLGSYLLVNSGLVLLDLWQGGGLNWAFWPLLGWGIGIAAHALRTFVGMPGWRARLVARELQRLQARRH
jgi:hypothetical protein